MGITGGEPVDLRSYDEREDAKKAFELSMRQAVMEFDALDTEGGDGDRPDGHGRGDGELDFREFSRLIREREIGVHSEQALQKRMNGLDADGSGTIDVAEYIGFALRDAFVRSAANLSDIFAAWDDDGNGMIDPAEFRKVVRHFGFRADDRIIDSVFATFDASKVGVLELRDLSKRLSAEVRSGKPMHELRCLAWRGSGGDGGSAAHMVTAEEAHIGTHGKHGKGIDKQIMAVLQAQSARVMDLFRSWDTDGDALISKKEFRDVCDAMGFEGTKYEIYDALFETLDKDGSGEMDYMEMKDAIDPPIEEPEEVEEENNYRGWGALDKRKAAISLSDRSRGASIVKGIQFSPDYDIISQLTTGLAANWGKLAGLFELWDTDGSGTLSRNEVRRALNSLGLSSETHPKAVDALFESIDTDRSGEVTFDEFNIAVRASLRAAKSAQLQAASKPSGAPVRLPAVHAASAGPASTMPSVHNRVGRVGPIRTVGQKCVLRAPAPLPMTRTQQQQHQRSPHHHHQPPQPLQQKIQQQQPGQVRISRPNSRQSRPTSRGRPASRQNTSRQSSRQGSRPRSRGQAGGQTGGQAAPPRRMPFQAPQRVPRLPVLLGSTSAALGKGGPLSAIPTGGGDPLAAGSGDPTLSERERVTLRYLEQTNELEGTIKFGARPRRSPRRLASLNSHGI